LDGSDHDELARLMQAALAGDQRAYGEFLDRAASLLRRFVLRKVGRSGIDPEDIVQEVLLAVHIKRHTWHQDAPVLPWLYAIARYKLADAFRRRGRRGEIGLAELAVTSVEPDVPMLERDVTRALDILTPGQRSVVSAVALAGRSIAEAAKTLGMSETAVRVALHRGLSAIARRFGQN
jgi:RNA polymerase sigma-70 factor (ECF subfamily)